MTQPLISCLCLTFNRFPRYSMLVEQAVACFLKQTDTNAELILCNDTPGQTIIIDHPRIRVLNVPERFPTLSDKITHMIAQARGELLCRWDDDDLHLPHRLSYSRARLGDRLEWRAENYWLDWPPRERVEVKHPANSHVMSLWRREVLDIIGGYPPKRSGDEDQAFNAALVQAGFPFRGETIPAAEIYYVYRWGVSDSHLSSGVKQPSDLQARYDKLGGSSIEPGEYRVAC